MFMVKVRESLYIEALDKQVVFEKKIIFSEHDRRIMINGASQ